MVVATAWQSDRLLDRPTVLKLGPVPHSALVKALSAEHSVYLAFRTVTRVMFYFGSFFDDDPNRLQKVPVYASMYNHLLHAIRLDPYNMDAYYFAQAAFTWEVERPKEVNVMLDHGIKFRTWDYMLPFYAGFNAAYFMKDYKSAARYMQIAAERSGNSFFASLAARYFNEAGQNELGMIFLDTMLEGTQNEKVRDAYQMRKAALGAVYRIEQALDLYRQSHDVGPKDLTELIISGYLESLPADPYGGEFFLDDEGRVRSTSKFALRSVRGKNSVREGVKE
jgi:tetratricopeptide (TPR) repeat protein